MRWQKESWKKIIIFLIAFLIALLLQINSNSAVRCADLVRSKNVLFGEILSFYSEDIFSRKLDELREHHMPSYTHSIRVAYTSLRIARNLGMTEVEKALVFFIGLFHDIGKLHIPKFLLEHKNLSKTELFMLKTDHVEESRKIISSLKEYINPKYYEIILLGVYFHHESIDGTGYPFGNNPTLYASIVSLADVYEALRETRRYRTKQFKKDSVLDIIRYDRCKFCSKVFDSFLRLYND